MKRYNALLFCAFISLIICFSACSNSTTIGADLLDSDRQDLIFKDDFVLKTSTVSGDTVQTFSPFLNAQLTNYLIGDYVDPVFGQVESSVYAQISTSGVGRPDFNGNTLDSVVLVLPYLVGGSYGDTDGEYSLDILRLSEDGDNENSLWSNTSFATEATPIGSKSFVPNLVDDVVILTPNNDSLGFYPDTLGPQLRIQLDNDFAMELFNADVDMESDSVFFSDDRFTEYFKGIHITTNAETGGLLNFNLRNNGSLAGIFVYYHTDNADVVYQFPLSASDMKVSQYNQDYSGSIIEPFINNTDNSGDSLFFLQGLEGVYGMIELPDLSSFEGEVAINKAELILTVAELPEDSDIYTLPQQLVLEAKNDLGNYEYIYDVAGSDQTGEFISTVIPSIFGGELTGFTDRPDEYSMNITAQIQDVLKGKADPQLRLSLFARNNLANRAVFYGGQHSTYPVKLRIYYTQF